MFSFNIRKEIFFSPSYFLSWYQSCPKTVVAMSEASPETASIHTADISEKTSEPLQRHSNSHSVQITTIRLNGDNFLRWSQSVRMYIRGQGKI